MKTALILAGGLGTRLKNTVRDKQKVAAEVAGHPFITYLIRQVAKAGIYKIILCAGYKAETLLSAVCGLFPDLEIIFSIESEPRGTAGALKLALNRTNDPELLVMNGDSYFDIDLTSAIKRFHQSGAKALLCLREMKDVSRYGCVTLAGDGTILSFEEKGTFQGSGMVNAGIYLMCREVLESIPADKVCSLEREIFPALVREKSLRGLPLTGTFIDIGTPESYLLAQQLFQKG